MVLNGIPISDDECIGDSLATINSAFQTLSTETINDYASLLSLLQSVSATLTTTTNTLSTNMQNIGNYPYLEYAWVTAPNTARQSIASDNAFKTLTLNSEVADSGGYGSLDAGTSRITLNKGTYRFEMSVPYKTVYNTNTTVISMLFNVTDNNPIRSNSHTIDLLGLANTTILEGQFTISSQKVLELRSLNNSVAANAILIKSGHQYGDPTNSSAGYDQRTTIRLWKVG